MSKLEQKLEQNQKLNPKQILEASIVQLNVINLEKSILKELEDNPALEIDEQTSLNDEESSEEEEEFDFSELVSNPEEFEYSKAKTNFIDNVKHVESASLYDDVLFQLYETSCSDDEINVAKHILGNLDENGFLPIEPILIADRLGHDESFVNQVRFKIQALEPAGVGSLTIQESVLSQLNQYYKDDELSYKIIKDSFDLFSKHKYELIAKKNNCTKEEVYKTVERISVLNPYPAVNYNFEKVNHIVPDIVLEHVNKQWDVQINEPNIPNLKISNQYIEMLNKYKKNDDVKVFIKQKITKAEWYLSAIAQRNNTITRVMKSIIKFQNSYFNSDNRILSPMILKDVANDIGMDISTVSRVSNGKYVQLPWGIRELKSFFSESVQMKNGNKVSSTVVKDALKEIINSEDKGSPCNDEEITKILNDKGYVIARRTVTKYRESMKILVSRLRKR